MTERKRHKKRMRARAAKMEAKYTQALRTPTIKERERSELPALDAADKPQEIGAEKSKLTAKSALRPVGRVADGLGAGADITTALRGLGAGVDIGADITTALRPIGRVADGLGAGIGADIKAALRPLGRDADDKLRRIGDDARHALGREAGFGDKASIKDLLTPIGRVKDSLGGLDSDLGARRALGLDADGRAGFKTLGDVDLDARRALGLDADGRAGFKTLGDMDLDARRALGLDADGRAGFKTLGDVDLDARRALGLDAGFDIGIDAKTAQRALGLGKRAKVKGRKK